jgi:translation initiation factor 2 beta subunit (eIF-2beta)/eIF-5
MATRLDRLEESLQKYYQKIEETKQKIEEEKQKIIARKDEEERKLKEAMERYQKMFGTLPGQETEETKTTDDNDVTY